MPLPWKKSQTQERSTLNVSTCGADLVSTLRKCSRQESSDVLKSLHWLIRKLGRSKFYELKTRALTLADEVTEALEARCLALPNGARILAAARQRWAHEVLYGKFDPTFPHLASTQELEARRAKVRALTSLPDEF